MRTVVRIGITLSGGDDGWNLQLARISRAYAFSGHRLYYWRDGNDEVDFILEAGNKIIAIEVKSSTSAKLSGMHAFRKKYTADRYLLAGPQGIPVEEFLLLEMKDFL